jgi:PH domain
VKQGTLLKKGANRRNWQQRWFVLKPKYLFYYVSHQDMKLKGVINLNNCSVGPDITSKKAFSFTINCKLRTYFIVAKNDQEMKDWIE